MLIALITVYFLGGGSFDLAQFLLDARVAVTESVSDAARQASALAVLDEMQAVELRHQNETQAMLDRGQASLSAGGQAPVDVLVALLKEGAERRVAESRAVVDYRFELQAVLTEDEWKAVFD